MIAGSEFFFLLILILGVLAVLVVIGVLAVGWMSNRRRNK